MSVRIILYQEPDGACQVLEFLMAQSVRAQMQARKRLSLLAEHGYQLHRPYADYLEDGIYELRWRSGKVQFRILYFFHGLSAVILAHALAKEDVVPPADLARAKQRKANFHAAPATHTRTYPGEFPPA